MGITNGIAKAIAIGAIFCSGYYLGGGCESKSHYSGDNSMGKISEQDLKIKNLEKKVRSMEDMATKYLDRKGE